MKWMSTPEFPKNHLVEDNLWALCTVMPYKEPWQDMDEKKPDCKTCLRMECKEKGR